MIGENTSLYQYYTAAGTAVAGMPETIPPTGMGQSTVGVTVAGMPETIPPTDMGQSTVGVTVAGIPNISTQTAGAVSTAGQISAGVTIAGMPETIPPTGVGTAGTVAAGSNSGKICIAATGATINSPVADIFDKAPYFLIVGFGSMKVIPNPNVQDLIGSGVQSAQLVVSEGAHVVITNDIGIKAIEELCRLQVKVYTGVTGTVKDALEWYQNNRLTQTNLNSSSDDQVNDEEEQHGPPSSSKSKSKGESTTL